LEDIGTIDLNVDVEFAGLNEVQRKRAIARRENNDWKEAWLQVLLETKEKKEIECLVKLVEKKKKKEREKEEKAKDKKKDDVGSVVPTSLIVDQSRW